ncbi:MAG: hypothetical protein GY751_01755 [Bacteroidetes bacterium]|nr:hypothetical protein [Bacteroidota bacterium]
MALDSEELKGLIITALKGKGFKIAASPSKEESQEEEGQESDNKHSKIGDLVDAIATAVVTHIMAKAEVSVTGGSSTGIYKVT